MNQIHPNEVKNTYYNINAGVWLLKRVKSLRRTQMVLKSVKSEVDYSAIWPKIQKWEEHTGN